MSKSTPLAELQNNPATNSTKPLVQDILKEIEQEENAPNMANTQMANNVPNMAVELPTNNMNSEMPPQLNAMQIADTSDNQQYAQQQQQALQYQLDANVNPPDAISAANQMGVASQDISQEHSDAMNNMNYNTTSINDRSG